MCASPNTIKKRTIRLFIVGDAQTGKFTYLQQLSNGQIGPKPKQPKNTMSVRFDLSIRDGPTVSLELVLLSSTLRGNPAIRNDIKNIDGLFVIFDLTAPGTYDSCLSWKTEVTTILQNDELPAVLLANKDDLEMHVELEATMETISSFCDAARFLQHFRISAKNGDNVQRSLHVLAEKAWRLSSTQKSARLVAVQSNPDPIERVWKIVVIGDKNVGKTSILERYIARKFSAIYRTTLGSDVQSTKIRYKDMIITLQFWDIEGEERFYGATHTYYRGAAGCILVYDLTNGASLVSGAVRWKNDLDNKVRLEDDEKLPTILLGNKRDLPKEPTIDSPEYMDKFCQEHEIVGWLETSAKTNTNISEAINLLIESILKSKVPENKNRPTISLTEYEKTVPEKRTKCCRLN